MIENSSLTLTCFFGSIVALCAVSCCFAKSYPLNYILLFIFTFCFSYMLGGFTSNFNKYMVITATFGTAMVTIALTLYAMTSRVEIEVFMGLVWVVCMAEFPLMFVGLFMGLKFLHIIYCLIGITFYSIFLIIDTKIICDSNKSMGGFDIDYDDYILCSL